MIILLSLFALAAPIQTELATTINISQADNIERRLTDSSYQPTEFYTSFSSSYKINNRTVKAQEFWEKNLQGKQLQIKASKRSGFWFVSRLNLLDTQP